MRPRLETTETIIRKYAYIQVASGAAFDLLLRTFSSLAKARSIFKPRRGKRTRLVESLPPFRHLVLKAGGADAAHWNAMWESPRESDVRTIFLGDAREPRGQGTEGRSDVRAILKLSMSARGAEALERHVTQLQGLRHDARLSQHAAMIPQILALERRQGAMSVIESALPGQDGRITMQSATMRSEAMVAALRVIASLHCLTASEVTIGNDWLSRWIDAPTERLRQPAATLMSSLNRQKALAAFRDEQRRFWEGRKIALGVGHGDLAPGNVLFSHGGELAGSPDRRMPATSVKAIIDWESGTPDAPVGFDAAHLLLTARALLGGGELGLVVKQMILAPGWSRSEAAWLDEAYGDQVAIHDWLNQKAAIRALSCLAWLHHVVANLQKSDDYQRNRLWAAANIERVLQVFLDRRRNGDT